MKKYSLSVIMPALNEEKNIEKAVNSTMNAFKKNNINGEIIIINDGSTDNTANIIQNLTQQYDNIKVITHDSPKGIGYSVWEGFKSSQKDIVVMFPSDNENDPEETLLFFDLTNNVDIIAPFICNIEVRGKQRKRISEAYNFIINATFGTKLNYHNGTTLYRRKILDDVELSSFGFFFQTELMIKLIKKGYLYAEVPNYLSKRVGGSSKALTFKSFLEVAKGYLKLIKTIHLKLFESKKIDKQFQSESVTYLRNLEFEEKLNKESKEDAITK